MAQKKSKGPKRKFSLERVPTGVQGLDKLLEGGFVKGSTVLLTGGTGTGKTIFCTQFLLDGLKRGERCLYITLEETPGDIMADTERFGWDLKKYADSGQLTMKYEDPFAITNISRGFLDHIKTHGYQRVAIDSTSILGLYFKSPFELRKQLFLILNALKKIGATVLVTAETPEEGRMITRFGVEEYVTDGVIVLHYTGFGGGAYYSLQVRKMRRTDHGKDIYPMVIGRNGVEVKKLE